MVLSFILPKGSKVQNTKNQTQQVQVSPNISVHKSAVWGMAALVTPAAHAGKRASSQYAHLLPAFYFGSFMNIIKLQQIRKSKTAAFA
jgi:hypothetical protein